MLLPLPMVAASIQPGFHIADSKLGKHALLTAVLQQSYELSTLIHKLTQFITRGVTTHVDAPVVAQDGSRTHLDRQDDLRVVWRL